MKKRMLIALVVVLALAGLASLVWANPGGLVSYWPFDEGSGITASDAVGTNHGTIHKADWVDGKFGKALSFDGVDDYVQVNDSSTLDLTEFTVQAWIFVKELKKYHAIVVKGPDMAENYELLIGYPTVDDVVSAILFTDGRRWLSTGGVIAQDTWHHVAVTYKPNEWRIYVDGVKRAERTDVASAPATNNYPVWIGNEQGTTGRVMYGLIDEVGIWNRALSAEEVAWLASPEVDIDIKPGSDPNCFNSDGHGVIPVAILSTTNFDATTVDPATVTLAGMGIRMAGKSGKLLAHTENVNDDALADLVLQIEDSDGSLAPGATTATLRGFTYDGLPIVGTDFICIVP